MQTEKDCDLVAKYELVVKKMGQAVACMHLNGIVHGDFHANNWFWDPRTKKFHVIDWGLSKDLGKGYISQPILLSPATEDIKRTLEALLSVALAHKFSRPSIVLIKTFFHGISGDLGDASFPDEFIWQWRGWFKDAVVNWIGNNLDFIITSEDLTNSLNEGRKIVRIAGLVQIINAAYYSNIREEIPSMNTVKERAMRTAKRQMEERIELRQETEDLEKIKAEENEKLQKQIAVWEGILADVSPEELRKLYDDDAGGGALIDAILAELSIDAHG
jgi:serine/threonine protein kinase